jgi:hypothetical protein
MLESSEEYSQTVDFNTAAHDIISKIKQPTRWHDPLRDSDSSGILVPDAALTMAL